PLDVDALEAMLSEDGLFSKEFPGFEYRSEQVEMMEAVADAFNDSGVLLVEAGTGTGKSLAYLLPAIHWAAQNNDRIVISTNTINLQDQLSQKDIPAIQKVLPLEFKFTVLKGRSNYLCLRRFDALRRQESHTAEEIRVLAKILAWLPSTTTGDMAELTFTPGELKVWARLASDPEHCTVERCANRPDKCFFWRARERADSAHLIIVNHALLLSDMALENRVLPEFNYLIVDEAHHLEARATDALAFSATRASFDTLARQISSERSGLVHNLGASLRHSHLGGDAVREFQSVLDQVSRATDGAQRASYALFDALEQFLTRQQENASESDTGGERQYRLSQSIRSQPNWSAVEIEWENLSLKLQSLMEGLEKTYRGWQEFENEDLEGYADYLQDILFAQRRVRETFTALEATVIKPKQSAIYWATVNRQTGDIGLYSAPLHVGDTLNKDLFAVRETVILTSATMSIGGSFSFIENRLGIGEWADHLQVGSPFDYQNAALVYIPNDIPEPGQQGYQKAIESALGNLLKATRGRALVLFTSHSQLQSTYRALARKLEEDDVLVLAQGLDGSRRQVLDTFRTQERMALFGTKSFWEGIDVVGEALSCLAMTRLPFSVPSDPIFAARSETFDDPFAQYAVPEAVLRFRQGFGRLIRSKSDRGVVVILDKRILTKSYGRLFLESLPNCTKQQGPLMEMPKRAAQWIDKVSAQ
ncbi:MAG TPA: helicase C-terminal domain-containing protein, partial [Anaerolineae bacterium]|nr:helicase C-terminal domain-containing protein [Anaerolineae bacterium]